jgi:hypothetical protein
MRRNKTLYTYGHFSCNLFWELHAASIMLFMPTNVTPQKRDERYLCVEVFSQELEELHQETFKNGENHKLGYVKTPLDYHSRFAHVYLLFFYQRSFIA